MLRLPLRQASRLPTLRRIALERSLPATVLITHRHSSTNASLPDEAVSHTPELINALLAANQHFVETFHGAGLPWWASIITATVCLRSALTLPIAVYQQRAVGRMLAVAPIVQSWGETLKNQLAREGKTKGWEYETYNIELQKQYRAKVKQIYRQNDCLPMKSFLLPWFQIPLFVCMSFSLRGMVISPELIDSLSAGGFGWVTDLTTRDPTMIFPIAIGMSNFLNVELNSMYMRDKQSLRQKALQNIFRGISFAIIPIAAQAPMALSLYWTTSSLYSVAQNVLFRVPAVRKALKLPIVNKPSNNAT
ncbi:hypothetical protein K450DRAFT_234320 [Umbelopsis ramanniana AG]|uniref:Membrane insertase YidC/Oxa/ALB C-terminal domain-containing protein n=1 Tax=Umbelopsis ramanniana AG TaxID=1314678 RepID=A0AAD5ECM7_UMBRA|nr:uncharacterized protein K450DRAFT_234320 [Umbelopsis ramanniana AG]KAI8581034.1 hypothetical protein K450DRAFT_234320 [Umbelopsis ramanniana AG]